MAFGTYLIVFDARGGRRNEFGERGRPLSAGVILPVAKALYLCDGHLSFTSRKTDLMGIFDSIRPQGGYSHIHPSFVVFARLAQGLGTIPFRVDIRLAASGPFVAGTSVQQLVFLDRDTIVNMVVTVKGVSFPQPGIFLVELLLDNPWVADTTMEVK
jgi:hypothetical protein